MALCSVLQTYITYFLHLLPFYSSFFSFILWHCITCIIHDTSGDIHRGSRRFHPRNAKKKRALEKKKHPENLHRLQCNSLFNVADLVSWMRKSRASQIEICKFYASVYMFSDCPSFRTGILLLQYLENPWVDFDHTLPRGAPWQVDQTV